MDTGHIGWKKMGVEVVRGGEEGRLGGGGIEENREERGIKAGSGGEGRNI